MSRRYIAKITDVVGSEQSAVGEVLSRIQSAGDTEKLLKGTEVESMEEAKKMKKEMVGWMRKDLGIKLKNGKLSGMIQLAALRSARKLRASLSKKGRYPRRRIALLHTSVPARGARCGAGARGVRAS